MDNLEIVVFMYLQCFNIARLCIHYQRWTTGVTTGPFANAGASCSQTSRRTTSQEEGPVYIWATPAERELKWAGTKTCLEVSPKWKQLPIQFVGDFLRSSLFVCVEIAIWPLLIMETHT